MGSFVIHYIIICTILLVKSDCLALILKPINTAYNSCAKCERETTAFDITFIEPNFAKATASLLLSFMFQALCYITSTLAVNCWRLLQPLEFVQSLVQQVVISRWTDFGFHGCNTIGSTCCCTLLILITVSFESVSIVETNCLMMLA